MDLTTLGGIAFAIACILFGQALEGGHAGSLVQLTAFIIVIGGTIGATAVSVPTSDLKHFTGATRQAFFNTTHDLNALITQVVEFASVARRDGVLALEQQVEGIEDPFMKRGLGFIVDGVDTQVARESMETEIYMEFEEATVGAKVYESAGGFAPTVGILGAVLGLIHVMENLSDPSALGPGIAVAFVATVYGVGIANLALLPMAGKIKRKAAQERNRKTLIAEGLLAIQEGLNPRVLEEKLRAYAGGDSGEGGAKA